VVLGAPADNLLAARLQVTTARDFEEDTHSKFQEVKRMSQSDPRRIRRQSKDKLNLKQRFWTMSLKSEEITAPKGEDSVCLMSDQIGDNCRV
jgi:hypothetical protein